MFHTDRDMNNNVCQHFLPKTKFRAKSTNPDKKQKTVMSNKTVALVAAEILFGVKFGVALFEEVIFFLIMKVDVDIVAIVIFPLKKGFFCF